MEKRQYPQEFLDILKTDAKLIEENGLTIIKKPIPDEKREGVLDPRLFAEMSAAFSGEARETMLETLRKLGQREGIPDGRFSRLIMNGIKSIPIVSGIVTEKLHINGSGGQVPVYFYRKKDMNYSDSPVIYYIHGGGFSAGRPEVMDELCRLFTAKSDCIVVQAEYRLAPEFPYPAGLDDCYDVLKWLYENIHLYGGSKEKICIAGDSAGGNLAAVCAMKDRDEGTHMVRAQILNYPALNLASVEDEEFAENLQIFRMNQEQKDLITDIIDSLKMTATDNLGFILQAADITDPYVSPYLGSFRHLPPCIILYGEFDYLRMENEAYARKLIKAGVDTTVIQYHGLSHGFMDQSGRLAQTEDAVDEILAFIEGICSNPESAVNENGKSK